MAKNESTTFADRLRKAQDLLSYIKGFEGYAPPRTEESIEGFQSLIASIVTANANETDLMQDYKFAVNTRQMAFFKSPDSVDRLFPLIKGFVYAQFGKKSKEAIYLVSIINKMRSTKINRNQTEVIDPENVKAITKSERSYGALTKYFGDIVSTISKYTDYNPSNPVLKLPALQLQSANLTSLNDKVAENISQLRTVKADRLGKYTELSDSVQRIKSYTLSHYGIESKEYSLVNSLKI